MKLSASNIPLTVFAASATGLVGLGFCAALTVQAWCPRSVQTVEQAAKECPCQFKDGQKMVVEFDLMEPNTFDAKNGVIVRAGSVLPLK